MAARNNHWDDFIGLLLISNVYIYIYIQWNLSSWTPVYIELLCRLQKVQNNAARVVSGSKKYDHITPVLKDLHWLPIRKRIEFKILLLTFKCMQGCAPLYLRELLVKQANTRTLRSNTKNLLQIPLTNLKRFGDRAFCAYAPRLWNELPDNIKAADSVQNFKKQLKTLLFRKEFNWLYGPWQLSNDSKALLNIIGGKGAISNINYYYYYIEHLHTLNNFSCPSTLPLKINGRLPGYIKHLSTLNIEHQICSRRPNLTCLLWTFCTDLKVFTENEDK